MDTGTVSSLLNEWASFSLTPLGFFTALFFIPVMLSFLSTKVRALYNIFTTMSLGYYMMENYNPPYPSSLQWLSNLEPYFPILKYLRVGIPALISALGVFLILYASSWMGDRIVVGTRKSEYDRLKYPVPPKSIFKGLKNVFWPFASKYKGQYPYPYQYYYYPAPPPQPMPVQQPPPQPATPPPEEYWPPPPPPTTPVTYPQPQPRQERGRYYQPRRRESAGGEEGATTQG